MRYAVIGAGAMGCTYGGRLAHAGLDVTFIDVWPEHVAAINQHGLRLDGVPGDLVISAPAVTITGGLGGFDVAIVTVDSNHTGEAAVTAAAVLAPGGLALTLQNGIGNVEVLTEALGDGRVVGGSNMCSACINGPGHVTQTHQAGTTIGELDGAMSERIAELAADFERAGFGTAISDDIMAEIWSKFIVNIAINALAAVTGLRSGEVARVPELDALQDRLLDEAFAVVRAKNIDVDESGLRQAVKDNCWKKYNKPSMLQHMEAGRRTEIDALNGALVREARALGLAVPCHETVVAFTRGRELFEHRRLHEPDPDYDLLERQAGDEARPGQGAA